MANVTGETSQPLRVAFDRHIKLEFHGARITSDGGLPAYRELDVLGLTATAASTLAEGRRGRNIRHRLLGLLRQANYGRLAGCAQGRHAQPFQGRLLGGEALLVGGAASIADPGLCHAAGVR